MPDIEIINDETVRFKKMLFHESELLLAKCFNFSVDLSGETTIIEAPIKKTSKRALYEFIRLGFKRFNESPLEESRRKDFYDHLARCYDMYNSFVDGQIKLRLPYHERFYAHQPQALRESYYKQDVFLALDMGLGKSIISASLSRLHQDPVTVIICPAAVKWNWYRDLTGNFQFNDLYFTILDTRKSRMIRALVQRFIIVNYDITGTFYQEIVRANPTHFIFDEAHQLKNHNSQRYKNIKKILDNFPDARRTFLSGTPVKNRVNDVFAYLKLINHPLGGNYKKFLDEYTIKTTIRGSSKVSGGRNLQELYVKLSNFMIRKTKEECLDLPEKIFFEYKYSLEDYRQEYDKVIKELSEMKEISSLTGSIHSLNKITAMAKIPGIIELAEEIVEQGRKVVIFGGYTDPIEKLVKHFGNRCVKVTGSVDAYNRDQCVQRFHNDPECEIFVGNMQAAGVGINLTNATDVIFMNFPFTSSELNQAIDRLHRIGQKSSVNVHYTFCEESIDDYIYELIVDKQKDINALIDKGKEVDLRENFTEILIQKLLNKNGINNKVSVSEVVEKTEEKNVGGEGVMLSEGLPVGNPSGTSTRPKYYLMVHPESDCIFILNQKERDEFDPLSQPDVHEDFSNENINTVFERAHQVEAESDFSFSGKYNPNEEINKKSIDDVPDFL